MLLAFAFLFFVCRDLHWTTLRAFLHFCEALGEPQPWLWYSSPSSLLAPSFNVCQHSCAAHPTPLHTHTSTAHLTVVSFCFLVCVATPVCKKLWSRMTHPALPVVAAPTPTLTLSPMMTLPLKYAVITAFGCGAACKLNNKKPWHSSLSLLFGGLLETYLAFCFCFFFSMCQTLGGWAPLWLPCATQPLAMQPCLARSTGTCI